MRRHLAAALVVGLVLAAWGWGRFTPAPPESTAPATRDAPAVVAGELPAFLPPEAHATLRRVLEGGPFPYRQDGGVFHNREGLLPPRPDGYYREYTVDTPGSPDRGARRLVTGGDPPREFHYTDDHYRSFRRFELPAGWMP